MLRRSFLSVLPAISLFGLNKQNLWPEFIKEGQYIARNKNNYCLFSKIGSNIAYMRESLLSTDRPRLKENKFGPNTHCSHSWRQSSNYVDYIGRSLDMETFHLQDLLQPYTMIDRAGNIYYE